MKLLTIAVPCYNSQDYMENCIDSLLVGGEEVEILIIDDGSKDDTAKIADRLQQEHPTIVRAIHQENKGHGGAVNTGIENAQGLYFKVVDSDDKVKAGAYKIVLDTLRNFKDNIGRAQELDLLISNFVYNKEEEGRTKVMSYRRALPQGRLFSWEETRRFRKGQYILMHSVIYRTELLRENNIQLPEHCFYVDNIYVFAPMPFVKNIYYLDVNFYYYYIGREDQSVNEKVMISRLDQQARVNRIMTDYFTDPKIKGRLKESPHLYKYMYNYLEIITVITSVMAICSGEKDKLALMKDVWDHIQKRDNSLFLKMRLGWFGLGVHLPGRSGRATVRSVYRVARRLFNFN